MKLISYVVGEFETNAYFVVVGNSAILIDPGGDPDKLIGAIEENKLNISLYIITHAHYDHFGAIEELRQKYYAPVCIHELDAQNLVNPVANLSAMLGKPFSIKPDILLKDKDKIDHFGVDLAIIHTPGHTPGSISILCGKNLFSGDTLFRAGVGRTDLPGGDYNQLKKSLEKILSLPYDTLVLPGHGEQTTIGKEKIYLEI